MTYSVLENQESKLLSVYDSSGVKAGGGHPLEDLLRCRVRS